MAKVYIGIGSNLGDRRKNINAAINCLKQEKLLNLTKQSSLYETEPVGGPPQRKFLNGAIELETDASPRDLLEKLKAIERKLGRDSNKANPAPGWVKWGPRTIDLDILLYDNLILEEPGLTIPHPLFHKRIFVLRPLAEIAPEAKHPVLKTTVKELLLEIVGKNENH